MTAVAAPHVLVTGGPGFIGRRVVQRFLGQGWRVSSLSLPGEAPLPAWQGRVNMLHGDLSDPAVSRLLPSDLNAIVHLAAPVGVAGAYERQWQMMVDGTRHLCAAAGPGMRVVVVSSIAVYGDRIRSQVCHEADGFGAWQGAYGRAKQARKPWLRHWRYSRASIS